MFESSPKTANQARAPLAETAAFNLIYLAFYFIPWLFKPPTQSDILAAIIALAFFLPIYFLASKQKDLRRVPYIIALLIISFAVSPYFGSHGVFYIYALVIAGFIQPERYAWVAIALVTIAFMTFSSLSDQALWDSLFPVLVGIITCFGIIATARRIVEAEQAERQKGLDHQIATVSERERIAQDLHDLLGQTLTMIALKSEVADRLFEKDSKQAKQEISDIRETAKTALKDVREAVAGLNTTSLEKELHRAKKILDSANISLVIPESLPELSAEYNRVLGLVTREAITNIVRHSNATQAHISLVTLDQQLQLNITDNGNLSTLHQGTSLNDGVGLNEGAGINGVRKRIEKLGGITNITFEFGFKLVVEVPLTEATP